MAKKPLQFNVNEKLREDIDIWVKDNEVTLSEFLRNSAKTYMILKNYIDEGYSIVLKKKDQGSEKEIILS